MVDQRCQGWKRLLRALPLVFLIPLPTLADSEILTLLDLDNNPSTGCDINTANGMFSGVERVVTTTLNTAEPPRVTGVGQQRCSAGALIADPGFTPLTPPTWPIGMGTGDGGADVVESYALPGALGSGGNIRMGFLARLVGGVPVESSAVKGANGGSIEEDALTSLNGEADGPAISFALPNASPIPALGWAGALILSLGFGLVAYLALRRRGGGHTMALLALCVVTGLAYAAQVIVRDGQVDDWAGVAPLATDPAGDGPPNTDLHAVYFRYQAGRMDFRFDIDIQVDDGPSVVSSTPADAATVARDAVIGLHFSEPVNVTGNWFHIVCSSSGTHDTANTAVTGGPVDFTLDPNADLAEGESCVVTVDHALVADQDGIDPPDTMAADHVFGFNVDVTPTVTSNAPAANATGVARDANVVLNFSEAVGVSGNWFQIDCPSGMRTPANSVVSGGGSATLTIDPNSDFSESEHCAVTVYAAQISDVDDVDPPDAMSANHSFGFDVVAVNNPPAFTKGANQIVLEDAGLVTVAGWATAINPGPAHESGQTVSFNVTGNTNPALFAGGPSVSTTGTLSFTPTADASGSATITLRAQDSGGTANGGVDLSAEQSFTITVSAVNDVPTFTKGVDQTVLENAGAQTVTGWATAMSKGPGDESSQTFAFNITGNTNPGLFAVAPTVSPTGTLTYTPAANVSGVATLTLEAQDNGGGTNTSTAQTFSITVTAVNNAPLFTKGANQTVLEDAGAQTVNNWATAISAGPADESGQSVSFNVTNNTNAALFAAAPAVSSTGTLTYTPAANANGSATITLELQDNGGTADGGADTSAPETFTITVTGVNDAPSFTKGADQTVLEDSGAHTIAGWTTAMSTGPSDESGQSVAFNVTGNTNSALFSVAPAVSASGELTYTLAANANGSATITLEAQDNGGSANGGSDTSAAQTFTVGVTDINDAPSFTKGADQTVDEDSGPRTVAGWATALSAGPGEGSQTVDFEITGNTNPGLFSAAPAVSSTGTLTYTSAANLYGTATITLRIKDNGGTANGGADTSASQSFVITVNSVPDQPLVTGENYETLANVVLEVAGVSTKTPGIFVSGNVLSNDSDPEGIGLSVVVQSNVITPTNAVVNMNSDGSFTYSPPPGFTGDNDSFNYTVTNSGSSAVGTVTVAVKGAPVWFVKNNAATNGKGRSEDPFDTLAEAETASLAGDTIYIYVGDGTATGQNAGIALKDNQRLLGEYALLDVPTAVNGGPNTTPLLAATGARPRIDDSGAGGIGVSMNDVVGVEIRGLDIAGGTNAVAINNTGATGTVTLRDNVISAAGDEGVNVDVSNGILTLDVQNNGLAATGNAFDARTTASGLLRLKFNNHANITSTTGTGIYLSGTAADALTVTGFANNGVHGNTGGTGISANTVTFDATPGGDLDTVSAGTLAVGAADNGVGGAGLVLTNVKGDLSFTDLDVYTDNGSALTLVGTGALTASTGTRLAVSTAAAGNLVAVGGAALDASGATLALPMATISSSGSAGRGISIAGGAGSVSATGGSIATANSYPVYLSGGTTDLSYPGPITNGTNTEVVYAADRTGGTVALSGAITSNSKGIHLENNTGSTFDLSGDVALNTGVNAAFSVIGGGTVNASNAASGITTTTGTGFSISGGANNVTYAGTVQTTGAGRTLSVTDRTGGVVNLSGNLSNTDTAGTGVLLGNNANTTINLSGDVDLNTGTNMAFSVLRGGTVNVSHTGASITTTTGTGFNVDGTGGGATGNVSYAGTVLTTGAGRTLYVNNKSGGTVAFTGKLSNSNTAGTGVSLTSNGGATVRFSGGIELSTGTNAAFTATGGGTVEVCDENPCNASATGLLVNTLTTTTGTALNVANTGIGANNLEFRRITAGTAASGPANAIVLNATGASGGLRVVGTGSVDSGGIIQRTTGHAISLTNTYAPSFTRMRIADTSGSGIQGTGVTHFSFTNGTINNSGTGLGVDTSNIAFNTVSVGNESNLSGQVTITGNTLTNARYHGIDIQNYNGTITGANISNNTLTSSTDIASSLGSAIHLVLYGSASTVASLNQATIDNNIIANFPSGAGISIQGGNGNAAGPVGSYGLDSSTNRIAITNNRVSGASAVNPVGTNAILTALNGRASGNFDISNNGTIAYKILHTSGNTLSASYFGQASGSVLTDNNQIEANNAFAAQGIGGGVDNSFGVGDTPSLTWTITDNTMSKTDGNGILAVARNSNGTLNAKVQNNSVTAPLGGARPGIRVDSGTSAVGTDTTVCLNMTGNTSAGSGGHLGLGLRKQGTDPAVNAFAVNGMAATATPGVEAYVNGNNPAGGGTLLLSITGTSGFSNCSLP